MNNSYRPRYLEENITNDLKDKMVFIGGPRQIGKTTLSRDIIGKSYFKSFRYYNWDSRQDRKLIIDGKIDIHDLIIFDEIHKYSKWKSLIKGLFDKKKDGQSFMITGSARLNVFRKGGDSLQGRYHYYRLHPYSFSELDSYIPKIVPFEALNFSKDNLNDSYLDMLLTYSGFPDPFEKQSDRYLRRWHKEKLERLFNEDVRDLSNIINLDLMQLLADMLPERVASQLSINNIRHDLEVSHRSISNWLTIFESLYYSFRIYPYQSTAIRALKKEPKCYLWDWSEVTNEGARFENFIASHLLKTVHYLSDFDGYNAQLYYLRDKEKREVDFLVTINQKPWFSVEVKLNNTDIPTSLNYFNKKLNIPFSYLITKNKTESYYNGNIQVLDAPTFLSGLI